MMKKCNKYKSFSFQYKKNRYRWYIFFQILEEKKNSKNNIQCHR